MDDETYEADETYEPIRPKSSEPPPLPRMWKDPVDAEPVESLPSGRMKKRSVADPAPAPRADKPKKKKKQDEEVIDDGTGAIKLEETPVLDTYEARQRARWLFGGILGIIALSLGGIVWKAVKGSGGEESRDTEAVATPVVPELRASAEQEARYMLENARKADEHGRTTIALEQLNKLVKVYQGTAAAREAMHAIARYKQEMPLFGEDVPAEVGGPKPPPPGTSTATGPTPPKDGLATNANPGPTRSPNIPPTAPMPPPAARPPDVAPAAPSVSFNPLPSGYRPRFEFPIHGSGWPTRIVCDRDGAEMILVPAATFLMGRDDGEEQESPTHQVFVSTFYIDLHEVTVRQYLRYLKDSGRGFDASRFGNDEDLPVVGITHKEATAYCTWANRRLPTEAQWELAARGPGLGRISYWNGELPRKDPAKGPRAMERVMSLESDKSPYGAFDMGANAWEWASDFHDSRFYQKSRGVVEDPTGPKTPLARRAEASVRGGSKRGYLTWRDGLPIESKLPYLGFRGALPVEGAPVAPPVPKAGPNSGPGLPGNVPPL